MTREVVGVVEEILEKSTGNGGNYLVLRINGEGYFDWRGLINENQVSVGDSVRLSVGTGKWPRVYDLEKLGDGEIRAAASSNKTSPAACRCSRDERITRLACARTASMALTRAKIPVKEKVKELFCLAEQLEKWVNRVGDEPEREPR